MTERSLRNSPVSSRSRYPTLLRAVHADTSAPRYRVLGQPYTPPLKCVAVCCSVLYCVAWCCNVLQCVAVCCSVLQCVAVCCIRCEIPYILPAMHPTLALKFVYMHVRVCVRECV